MKTRNQMQEATQTLEKQKPHGGAAKSADRTLKRAIGYGALFGLILGPVATAIAVGFEFASDLLPLCDSLGGGILSDRRLGRRDVFLRGVFSQPWLILSKGRLGLDFYKTRLVGI